MKKYLILCIITILSISGLLGQRSNSEKSTYKLHLLGYYAGDKVLLRWAPSDYIQWKEMTKSGVRLQRATLPDSYNALDAYDYDPSFDHIVKALPKDDQIWKNLVEKDGYAIAGWASLYKDRPEVSGGVVARLKSQDNSDKKAFFTAMIAADHSHPTSIAMGLGWEDFTIQQGRKYLYKVSDISDPSVFALMLVDCSNEYKLETPFSPLTISKDKAVTISWPRGFNGGTFTSYYIERANAINGEYRRLTDKPFLDINPNPEDTLSNTVYFIDSVPANYKPYYYRLIGINPFGIESNPSEPVMGMGRDLTPPSGIIGLQAIPQKNSAVKLTWQKKIKESDFKGYFVLKSEKMNGPYYVLNEDILPFEQMHYIDTNVDPKAYNFYKVSVVDTAGNIFESLPTFAMIEDHSPPPTPKLLHGSIDSNGIVVIHWAPVDDPYVIGYKVYSSNSPNHTFIMKSGDILTDTFYSERVTLRTLSEIIIYKVAAVNNGFGYSELSEGLELKRPDIVPPSSGAFKDYLVSGDIVQLTWARSNSGDLEYQELWRKDASHPWAKISKLDKTTENYQDVELTPGLEYSYALRAVDDDGLHSEFSKPVHISTAEYVKVKPIHKLMLSYNKEANTLEVKWDYSQSSNFSFVLYRSKNSKEIVSYKHLTSGTKFIDKNIEPNNSYTYALRVIDKDGFESNVSKLTTIETR